MTTTTYKASEEINDIAASQDDADRKGFGEERECPAIDSPCYFNEDFWLFNHVEGNIPRVLKVVFSRDDLDDYRKDLWDWLQAAISNGKSVYDQGHRRLNLMRFYESVLSLLVALHDINVANGNAKKRRIGDLELVRIGLDVSPEEVIEGFCTSYPRDYVRMEMEDWFDAGVSSDDFYEEGIARSYLFLLYKVIGALIESAFYMFDKRDTPVVSMPQKDKV